MKVHDWDSRAATGPPQAQSGQGGPGLEGIRGHPLSAWSLARPLWRAESSVTEALITHIPLSWSPSRVFRSPGKAACDGNRDPSWPSGGQAGAAGAAAPGLVVSILGLE